MPRYRSLLMEYNNSFITVGFDIRERYFSGGENYTFGKGEFVTMDTSLCERYEKSIIWHYENNQSYPLEFHPAYEELKSIYGNLTPAEKKIFTLYAFEIYSKDMSIVKRMVGSKEIPLYQWALTRNLGLLAAQEWQFQGYDVCGAAIEVSAVTNCAYKKEEIEKLGKLNKNFLLEELHGAVAFQEFANKDAIEHAPFVIWKI